ncbi:MAG: hypothetical protein WCS70_09650 [Verrucomicrobiota bacterium]
MHAVKSTSNSSTRAEATLPNELQLIPARIVRQYVPETSLWRFEKSGELPALRLGRRRFYRLSDWQNFLNRAAKAPPIVTPWANSEKPA